MKSIFYSVVTLMYEQTPRRSRFVRPRVNSSFSRLKGWLPFPHLTVELVCVNMKETGRRDRGSHGAFLCGLVAGCSLSAVVISFFSLSVFLYYRSI